MAVRVGSDDLLKIATNIGRAGKPMPQWVRDEPRYVAAYDQGTGDGNRAAQHLPPQPPRRASVAPSSSSPAAATRPPSKPKAGRPPGYFRRAFSPGAAAGRVPGVRQLASGGDAGGLLLAFVLYPIFLAVVKNGPAGIGMWFRAKWLNEAGASNPDQPAQPAPRPAGGVPTPGLPQSSNPYGKDYFDPSTGKFYPNGKPLPKGDSPA
jgi:hypothetical protein